MRQTMVVQISEAEFKKAKKNGAMSIVGKHEGKILHAEVDRLEDGSCWLAYEREVEI